MSQIKLLHSGGNGVILSAPDSNPASDRTLKLPGDADGTILTSNSSTGKILQVQHTNNSTQAQYTSTSFVVTNLTVNITPTSASSKIYITSHMSFYKNNSSAYAIPTIYRDSTNLGNASYGFGEFSNLGSGGGVFASPQYVDSPNTTSQVTYAIYIKVNSGNNVYICSNNTAANITVMEIAA